MLTSLKCLKIAVAFSLSINVQFLIFALIFAFNISWLFLLGISYACKSITFLLQLLLQLHVVSFPKVKRVSLEKSVLVWHKLPYNKVISNVSLTKRTKAFFMRIVSDFVWFCEYSFSTICTRLQNSDKVWNFRNSVPILDHKYDPPTFWWNHISQQL